MADVFTIDPQTRARFILGKSGLWPGRRWQGKQGVAEAINGLEMLQIDPVMVIAQSHDLALWGRVQDYQPAHLNELLDIDREFFAYGACLYIYPMADLPLMRTQMNYARYASRYQEVAEAHPGIYETVLEHIRTNGPSRSRKMQGNSVEAYRSSKDVGLALFYLWLVGDLMIHSRSGRDRVYDLTERIANGALNTHISESEAIEKLAIKSARARGIVPEKELKFIVETSLYRRIDNTIWKPIFEKILNEKSVIPVMILGERSTYYYAADDHDDLVTVSQGDVPALWKPLGATTLEEVTFLSPLDMVSARGRAKKIFNFDYVWEIYKPEKQRAFGPYTLPILYGDQLVGRMDGRADRKNGEFIVNGRWLEDGFTPTPEFEIAYEAGSSRLRNFLFPE